MQESHLCTVFERKNNIGFVVENNSQLLKLVPENDTVPHNKISRQGIFNIIYIASFFFCS